LKPEEPSGEHGERDREPADNVVQLFPRDWLGSTDQLVPLRPPSGEHEGRPSWSRRGRRPVPRRISGPAGGIGGDPAAPDREAAESERSEGVPPRHLAPVRPAEEPGGGPGPEEPDGEPAEALWNADRAETPDEASSPPPAAGNAGGNENRDAAAPLSAQSFWSDAAPLLHDPIKPVRPPEDAPASASGRGEGQQPKRRSVSVSVARALGGTAVLALVAMAVVGMVGFPGQVWRQRSALAPSAAGTAERFTAASPHHPLGGLHAELFASGTESVTHRRRADDPPRRDAIHRRSVPHVSPRPGAAAGISESASSVASSASAGTTSVSSAPAPTYGSAGTAPTPTGEPAAAPATAEAAAGGASGAGASTASGPQGAGAPFGPGQLN
jgi:hypothetical protein